MVQQLLLLGPGDQTPSRRIRGTLPATRCCCCFLGCGRLLVALGTTLLLLLAPLVPLALRLGSRGLLLLLLLDLCCMLAQGRFCLLLLHKKLLLLLVVVHADAGLCQAHPQLRLHVVFACSSREALQRLLPVTQQQLLQAVVIQQVIGVISCQRP
jgi:hypothetical protein